MSGATTIEDATVSGGGSILIDARQTLTLNSDTLAGLTLSGGTIVDASTVTVSGATTIEDATVSGGWI